MADIARRLRAALQHAAMSKNVLGAVVIQLALLVSGVLSARLLGPENRGYLALITTLSSMVCQLGVLGISLAATYFLASGQIGGNQLMQMLRRPVALQVIVLTIAYAGLVFSYTLIFDAPIAVTAALSLAQIPGTLALDYGAALLLGAHEHTSVTRLRTVAPLLLTAGLTTLYVLDVHSLQGVTAIASFSIVAAGALALIAGVRRARCIPPPARKGEPPSPAPSRRRILAFGRKGYFGYLSPTDSFRLDQLVVGLLLSPRSLGVYAVAAAFTNFTRVVATNVGMSATPEVARLADGDAVRSFIRRTLLISAVLVLAITLTVGVVAIPAIPILFGQEFDAAIPIAEVLLAAGGLLSIKRIAVDLLRGAGEPQLGMRAEAVSLGTFAILCVPGAVALGSIGVAASLLVAAVCGFAYLLREIRVHIS